MNVFRRPRHRGARQIDAPPPDIGTLWSAVAKAVPYSIIKDETWWRWRFAEHPHAPYRYFEVRDGHELVAAAVTRDRELMGGNIACILELLATTPQRARDVVGAVVADAEVADAVAFRAPRHRPQTTWAQAAGLRLVPTRLTRERMVLRSQFFDDAGLADKPWAVTWGDTDYV